MAEYDITFHINADTEAEAEKYRQRMLKILDENQHRILDDLNGDEGAYCSGHVIEKVR